MTEVGPWLFALFLGGGDEKLPVYINGALYIYMNVYSTNGWDDVGCGNGSGLD